MRLIGSKAEQFTAALLDAFPSHAKLTEMIQLKLNKNLQTIALGENLREVIVRLVVVAEAEGWAVKLICAACEANPGNPLLIKFFQDFTVMWGQKGSSPSEVSLEMAQSSRQSYQLPNTCHFDLTRLVEDALEKIEGKRGLVAIGIPCDEDLLLENFCERLKKEIGRNNVHVRRRLTIKPTYLSVDEAVTLMKRCKQMLQGNDILYPIAVQMADKALSNAFWQKICAEFTGDFPHRLIVLMGGDRSSAFPDDVTMLDPPQFREAHVITWVRDVVTYLQWPHRVREIWTQKMVAECSLNNALHIGFVYEHLDYTIQLLQGNPSCEDFLDELEQRSLSCD